MAYFFDKFRGKSILITPEEKVRQQVLLYLQSHLGIPAAKIAVEGSLRLEEKRYRYDILVHDMNFNPLILIECKAQHIAVNQAVLYQLARYNMILNVPYLMATNGKEVLYCKIENGGIFFLDHFPKYSEITSTC